MSDQAYEYGFQSTRGRWRELAIEHLPDLRTQVLAATSHLDFWWSILELLSDAGTSESRRAEIQAVYDYAWWCVAMSGSEDLAVEVGTYFYEALSSYSDFDEQLPQFVTPAQFEQLKRYFCYRLSDEEFAAFRSRFYAARGEKQ